MERIRTAAPENPLAAHPLIGRFHLAELDRETLDIMVQASLALGGKRPVLRDNPAVDGIAGLLSPGERTIAESLKRTLDPAGLMNPHLGITG